jgi:hypothetical protein
MVKANRQIKNPRNETSCKDLSPKLAALILQLRDVLRVSAGRLRLKCDGTRAETCFVLSAKRTSPFKSGGRGAASDQSTTGSRGVRISGSNAGYTMFRGSVKSTGYPLHSPVSPSLSLPCVTVCHHISTGLYHSTEHWHFHFHLWATSVVYRHNIRYRTCPWEVLRSILSEFTHTHTRARALKSVKWRIFPWNGPDIGFENNTFPLQLWFRSGNFPWRHFKVTAVWLSGHVPTFRHELRSPAPWYCTWLDRTYRLSHNGSQQEVHFGKLRNL